MTANPIKVQLFIRTKGTYPEDPLNVLMHDLPHVGERVWHGDELYDVETVIHHYFHLPDEPGTAPSVHLYPAWE